jgi:hypothetical protein
MKKFSCGCGRSVRDVYFKNGEFMCGKCFWQNTESPYDYLINLLAAKGFVITYQNTPVLVMKQFSADDDKEAAIRPDENWVVVEGDDFWQSYSGSPENLRAYISEYGLKKDGGCEAKED